MNHLQIASRGLGARADFVGLRGDGADARLVFKCACGCGGHALVSRSEMEKVEAYRTYLNAKAATAGRPHCFGGAVYVTGHEPLGIAFANTRCGERTHLRATA